MPAAVLPAGVAQLQSALPLLMTQVWMKRGDELNKRVKQVMGDGWAIQSLRTCWFCVPHDHRLVLPRRKTAHQRSEPDGSPKQPAHRHRVRRRPGDVGSSAATHALRALAVRSMHRRALSETCMPVLARMQCCCEKT
jgi:hypothetical protein